jgi:peptidoglycan/LPS O-acetylase OafA/YrhL
LGLHLRLFSRIGNTDWIKFDIGMLGMFVFFVMSGFIITKMLMDERQQTGAISIRGFYVRRATRIFPALLGYLVGLGLLSKLGLASCSIRELLLSLTFIANYRYSGFASIGHLWSLSLEEHFYLVWPLVFSQLSIKNVSKFLLVVICVAPAIRLFYVLHGADWIQLEWHSESVADSLAMGCLLAIVQPQFHANAAYQWFIHSRLTLLVPAVIFAAGWQHSPLLYQGIGKTIMFAMIALGMDISMQRSQSMWGKLLNNFALVKLGTWSYSVYLWQQVFTSSAARSQPYGWFPINLALALAVGITSYHIIERPALRWGRELIARQRVSIIKTVEKAA